MSKHTQPWKCKAGSKEVKSKSGRLVWWPNVNYRGHS